VHLGERAGHGADLGGREPGRPERLAGDAGHLDHRRVALDAPV
jgi:hypothetical protein